MGWILLVVPRVTRTDSMQHFSVALFHVRRLYKVKTKEEMSWIFLYMVPRVRFLGTFLVYHYFTYDTCTG
jgi:hypothetical protein